MDFIKVGGRIKYYRNLLHLTQKELSMGRLSPKMISFLESNKKKITPVFASKLVTNFHEIAYEKGIKIKLEMKDLLISDRDYAYTLCNKWLEELDDVSYNEAKYQKILELAKEYSLDEPIFKAYEKMSFYHYEQENYSNALKYFEELIPLVSSINIKNKEIDILNTVGTCNYMLQDYNNAFKYYKKAYNRFLEIGIIDSEFEDKLLYNLTLCSSVMGNYNDALFYIEKLESIANVNNSELYTNLILKANIFMKVNRTQEALNIYKEVLNNDIQYLYIVQNNIAVAFMNLGKFDESIEFFTKSINNQLQSLSSNTTRSFIQLAEVYLKEKKYEEAFIFYGYGIDNAIRFKQTDNLIQCYESIYKVCIGMYKISKFDFYYKSIKGLYDAFSFDEEQLKRMELLEKNYISDINN